MELSIIQNRIYEIRGYRVMLDFDLAEMYGVQTKRLKEQVRRNIERFPPDFMFELTRKEWDELVAICDQLPDSLKHSTVASFAFTQEGVAMLSGVLRSPTAIQVNISIMRAFVVLRQYALGYTELNQKLENFMMETNLLFNEVYQALTELASKKELEDKPRRRVGYVRDEE